MTDETIEQKLQDHVLQLEKQLTQVLSLLESLSSENRALKAREMQLLKERSILHSKNDKVRLQVEAMIQRLKAMDSAG